MAASNNSNLPRGRRYWLRFSLRSFLVMVVVIGFGAAWLGSVMQRVRQQRQIVAQLKAHRAEVAYDYQCREASADSPGPWILRRIFGDDAFAHVEWIWLKKQALPADFKLLADLPKLKEVSVDGPRTNDELAAIVRLPDLKLYYSAATLEVEQLRSVPQLTSLTLHDTSNIDDVLSGVPQLPRLQTLQLLRTNVTSRGIAEVAKLTQLRQFHCYGTGFVDDAALEQLKNLTSLESLHIRNSAIPDAGLMHLSSLQHLQSLDISGSQISDAGLKHLVGLPALLDLNLSSTQITDAGMPAIGRLQSLRVLKIHYTAVTDEGIAQLSVLRTLKGLMVGPNVTREAAERLHSQLPGCEIMGMGMNNSFRVGPANSK
jgi:hypothetical protein